MAVETKKRKLIIIDDDAFLLSMYAKKFADDGYEVDTAVDANDFFTKVKAGYVPEVMLIDILLPGEDGFSILEKTMADPTLKSITKIMLSNLGQEEDVKKAMSLGARGYIIKAVNSPTEVLAKVADIIKTNQ